MAKGTTLVFKCGSNGRFCMGASVWACPVSRCISYVDLQGSYSQEAEGPSVSRCTERLRRNRPFSRLPRRQCSGGRVQYGKLAQKEVMVQLSYFGERGDGSNRRWE